MVVNVSAIYPLDCMIDQELWLIATAQHHKRILYCVLLAQEKIKIENSKYGDY